MRIRLISDLHREFRRLRSATDTLPPADCDVVVLAGDVDEPASAVAWAWRQFPDTPVLMVMGNHEFYGGDIEDRLEDARRAAMLTGGNVRILERDVVEVDGWRFCGTTLWTDYCLHEEEWQYQCMEEARRHMSDHQTITLRGENFWPGDALELHERSRLWLASMLREGDPARTVVVTHHGCAWGSVAAQWRRDPVSAAFVSDLEPLIRETRPALWVHGHVHASFDYQIGRTRVVANPRGYGSENAAWDPSLVLDFPEPEDGRRRALHVADMSAEDLAALQRTVYDDEGAYDLGDILEEGDDHA